MKWEELKKAVDEHANDDMDINFIRIQGEGKSIGSVTIRVEKKQVRVHNTST